jgi:hypothetical protein
VKKRPLIIGAGIVVAAIIVIASIRGNEPK